MSQETNPPPATVQTPPPGPEKIEPVIIPIHHAKAGYVAYYLQAAIEFAENVGTNQVLKGKSKALPDDRANQVILLTAKENMPFFGRIIHALDVPANEPSPKPTPPAQPPAPSQAGAAAAKDAAQQ